MTIQEFVRDVHAGRVEVGYGEELPDGTLVDGVRTMPPDSSAEDVAAEAFNKGVLDPARVTWDTAVRAVRSAIEKGPR